MSRIRVAILGGGAFAPKLCEALAAAEGMPELELRLAARRPDRLLRIAEYTGMRVRVLRPSWTLRGFQTTADALREAQVVILLIRAGGLEARAYDEEFPLSLGQVGDEGIGLGGAANAWRSWPVIEGIAREIARFAPDAMVLNMVAPLGITTRQLLESGLDALGICELPKLTERRLTADPDGGDPTFRFEYAGLNHLGWFWATEPEGRELLERRAAQGLVDRQTLVSFGAAPLHYYYEVFQPEAGARLGLSRRPGRAQDLIGLSDRLVRQFDLAPGTEAPELGRRPTPWFEEQVVPVVRALCGGPPEASFVNLPCEEAEWAPKGGVIELRCLYSQGSVGLEAPPTPPGPVRGFLHSLALSEELLFRAAKNRDRRLLAEAIDALPLRINDLSKAVQGVLAGERVGLDGACEEAIPGA